MVRALARSRDIVLAELRESAAAIAPAPMSLAVFGSFARGEADADSDLDVVAVREATAGPDDDRWGAALERWRHGARQLTGNPVNLIELEEGEAAELIETRRPPWDEIAREGVTLAGKPLAEWSNTDGA
jgi:hypothetical protein